MPRGVYKRHPKPEVLVAQLRELIDEIEFQLTEAQKIKDAITAITDPPRSDEGA